MNFKVLSVILSILFFQNIQASSLIAKCGEYQLQGYVRQNPNTYDFLLRLHEKSNSEIELPINISKYFKVILYKDKFVRMRAQVSYDGGSKKLIISKINSIQKIPINYLNEKKNPTIEIIQSKKCD